ncbi:MAG: hypothetical protein ABI867_05000 [Kofleriaceae bacterium]
MIRHAVIVAVVAWSGAARAQPGDVKALREAIAGIDEAVPTSVDAATKAADALGEQRAVVAMPELAGLIKRPASKKLLVAQIAAIRALGKFDTAVDQVVPVLAPLIEKKYVQPANRAGEEAIAIQLGMAGAAINALGELHSAKAIPVLVPALVNLPPLMMQLRRAIVASGPTAVDELRKVLRGEHAKVEAMIRERKLGQYCGDANDRKQCQPVNPRDFSTAIVLGDLRATKAVPELLAVLARPPLPAYYVDEAPGPSTHIAVFDALRKIGSADSAAKLRAIWSKPSAGVELRAGAVAAYGFVATDASAVDELGKIAADNAADDNLRQEAASAYARLARTPKHIPLLLDLAKKYLEASAKKRTEATALQPSRDAADAEFAKARAKLDAQNAKLLAITRDPKSSTDQIRAATAVTKQAQEDFTVSKQTHRNKLAPFKGADNAATAYLGFARMFQVHVARIEIAIRCRDEACFASSLKLTEVAAATQAATYLPDATAWTKDHKMMLVEAYIDRGMLELARLKKVSAPTLDLLLDNMTSDNQVVRQAILLALPRLAVPPCPACVSKLDAAIKAAAGRTTLVERTVETEILRNYFR